MARNVGNIEVRVTADTKSLVAQLTKAGAEAGKEAKEIIEEELDGLHAELKAIDGKQEAQVAKAQIEAILRGIEGTVDLDLAETRLALTEFREQQEAMAIVLNTKIELSDAELARIQANYRSAVEIMEEQKIKAELELNIQQAQIGIEKFKAQQARDKIELQAELELIWDEHEAAFERQRIEAELNGMEARAEIEIILREGEEARVQAELDRMDANIKAELDATMASAEMTRWRREHGEPLDVAVRPETLAATAAFDAWIQQQQAKGIDVDVDPDTIRGTIAFEKWVQEMEREKIDVKVDIDESSANASLGRWGKIFVGILVFAENLGAALEGAVSAGTAVLSSGINALGGAAGAAAPLVASLGVALGAVVIGSQGASDAMKAVTEEFNAAKAEGRDMNMALLATNPALTNLAPSATAAALAFGEIRGELEDMRVVVQQDLFEGMADSIASVAESVLPSLQEGLRVTAQSVNDFGRSLADVAANTDFQGMIEALDPALDDALDAGLALARTIEPFLKAAAKPAERLAEMIERAAEGMEVWVAANPDQIAAFLDDGLTSLESWVELLKSTGDLLGTIFSAGSESGNGFVVALNNIIERWDGFLESTRGQEALTEFFDRGREAMQAFAPALDGLKELFTNLVDADSMVNLEAFGEAIGNLLPALGQISSLLADVQIANAIALLAEGLGHLAAAFNLLPDGVLEFAGIVIIATKAVNLLPVALLKAIGGLIGFGQASIIAATESAAAATGVGALSAALKLLVVTNAPLLILAATVAAVMLAFKLFGDRETDATKRTNELTTALQNNVDAMINAGDASKSASVGMDALNQTIFETGKGGDKLQQAFADINAGAGDASLGIEDATNVILDLRTATDGGSASLAGLAEGYGLPAEAAAALGEIVASTDDNLEQAQNKYSEVGSALVDLAEKTGIPVEELQNLFGALEEVQDQAENTDVNKIADEFLRVASTGTEAEQTMLKTAQATAEAAGAGDDAIAVYKLYTEALNDANSVGDDASSTNDGLASSYILVQDSINDALAAHRAEAAALKESRDAAFDAWKEEEKLANEAKNAAKEILASSYATDDARASMGKATDDIIELGEGFRAASDEASALNDALDMLLNPFLSVQEAASQVAENTDAMQEALMGGADVMKLRTEAWEEGAKGNLDLAASLNVQADALALSNKTLDLNTEAGRENASIIRDSITGITDQAAAQLEAGVANEEVTATALAARDALLAQAEGYFTTSAEAGTARQQAENYINALGLTPELINTVFSQPGLIDALLNAEDLTLLYDDAGNPVITEFEAAGIDPAMATAEGFKTLVESMNGVTGAPTVSAANIDPAAVAVEGVQEPLDTLSDTTAAPAVEIPTAEGVLEEVEGIQTAADDLDATTAVPAVTLPTAAGVQTKVEGLQGQFDTLDATSVSVNISTPGLQTAIDKVNELDQAIDTLTTNRTVTITERTVKVGGMTGALITGPRSMNVGELGYTEALIPLELPLNRVDPSVRHFAEILRGGGPVQTVAGAGKVVNNYMTIQPVSADPMVVATQVINRSASLANR